MRQKILSLNELLFSWIRGLMGESRDPVALLEARRRSNGKTHAITLFVLLSAFILAVLSWSAGTDEKVVADRLFERAYGAYMSDVKIDEKVKFSIGGGLTMKMSRLPSGSVRVRAEGDGRALSRLCWALTTKNYHRYSAFVSIESVADCNQVESPLIVRVSGF